jgi:hypothetical protein
MARRANFNYNPDEYVELENDSGVHYIPIKEIFKDYSHKWRGQGLYIGDLWFPMDRISTDVLIKYMRGLQNKARPTDADQKKIRYLAWVIKWRNQDPSELPKEVRAIPQQWKLDDINEYCIPPGS